MQHLLPTDEHLLNSISESVSLNKAEAMLKQVVKYHWLGYVLAPILLLLKWLFVSSLMYAALFFSNITQPFYSLWRIAV